MNFPGQAGRPEGRPLQQDSAHSLNTPDTLSTNMRYSFLDGIPLFNYSDYERFLEAVKDHIDALKNTASSLYLNFCGVSSAEFDVLADDQHRPTKSVRFSYHHPSQTLLLKFRPIPGGDHETLISLFQEMINEQLRLMGIYRETLSRGSPLTRTGEWTKEPDWCWAPRDHPASPKCVVEVGVSESTPHLVNSARAWIENRGSTVEFVVTIRIPNPSYSNTITIEVWAPGDRSNRYGFRNCRPRTALREQFIEITRPHGGVTTLTGFREHPTPTNINQLRLDSNLFIGRSSDNSPVRDIVLDQNTLLEFADEFFYSHEHDEQV